MTDTELNYIKRTLEVQEMINATFRDFLKGIQDCKTLEEIKDLTIMTLMDLNNLMGQD